MQEIELIHSDPSLLYPPQIQVNRVCPIELHTHLDMHAFLANTCCVYTKQNIKLIEFAIFSTVAKFIKESGAPSLLNYLRRTMKLRLEPSHSKLNCHTSMFQPPTPLFLPMPAPNPPSPTLTMPSTNATLCTPLHLIFFSHWHSATLNLNVHTKRSNDPIIPFPAIFIPGAISNPPKLCAPSTHNVPLTLFTSLTYLAPLIHRHALLLLPYCSIIRNPHVI